MNSIEVSAAVGAFIVHAAVAKGADAAVLAHATEFDLKGATDPDARIPLALEVALWNEAARVTGDDAFGLHAAALVKPGTFDVLDYAIRTAPTLRGSLERLMRYNRLVYEAAVFTLITRGPVARIEHAFRAGGAVQSRHSAEFTIASVLVFGEQLIGMPLAVRAVEFRHGRPADAVVAEQRRIFGTEPRFASNVNALEIDAAALDHQNITADPALSRLVERHAEALLAARPDPAQTVADRVRRALANVLGQGKASLGAVAAELRASERTLQRKLADEGVTFEALLDETRRDLALRYLADPKIAIAEVAYLLGYSEPSPFHRAFKRWMGITPSEARKRVA